MITDLESTEERLSLEDGDFLSIVADQISAGVALFYQNMQLENRAVELMFAKEQVENSLKDLEKSQFHLIQTEKASAIGQLVAGVAHEINSPLGR
jgi:phosphoglycerate-specific signal transduction histidine kinase